MDIGHILVVTRGYGMTKRKLFHGLTVPAPAGTSNNGQIRPIFCPFYFGKYEVKEGMNSSRDKIIRSETVTRQASQQNRSSLFPHIAKCAVVIDRANLKRFFKKCNRLQ